MHRGTGATYVRTLATYFKSVEHIIQVWNYCGTCINYRNLNDIYEEYKGDNLNIINKLPRTTTMHFIGRVTMLFANNSLMECLITMKFLHIFLHPDVIFIYIPCLLILPQRSLLL